MPTPLVSYIIPSFNTPPQLLVDCVNSILSVDMGEWGSEVIVVDDGSDNPVSSVLHDFEDVVTVISIKHQGVAEARNKGLEAAKGKYVQFVDSDDEILNLPYKRCLTVLHKEQPDILLFKLTCLKSDIQDAEPECHLFPSGADYMVNNNVYASLPSFLFRRTLARGLRFTPHSYHEDEEFVPLVFIQAHKFILTEASPYLYKQRAGSIVHSFSSSMVKQRLDDFYNIILRLKDVAEAIRTNEKSDEDIALKYQAMTNTVRRKSQDYVINVIRLYKKEEIKLSFLSRWCYVNKKLELALKKMKTDGLFPLRADYKNKKHAFFRFVVNNRFLRRFLPIVKC